jgi:hypothetical protein
VQTSKATKIGALAAQLFGRDDYRAEVIAIMSQAVYLRDRAGQILWLAPEGGTPHRRAILARLEELDWRVGAACSVRERSLCVAGGTGLQWESAPIWREPRIPSSTPSLSAARSRFRVALRALLRTRVPRGWALLGAGDVERVSRTSGRATGVGARFAEEAEEPVLQALESCRARDTIGLLRAGERLVGLGDGLTPSGDDFLGGLLFFQRQLGGEHQAASLDWVAVDAWVAKIGVRTNAISYAILSDLANGHGPEPLHDLACAMVAGEPSARIASHAARLTKIGQSSGWDMLTGVAAGIGIFPLVEPQDRVMPPAISGRERLLVPEAAGELAAVRGAHGD